MIYNQRSDAVLLRQPMGLLVATLHIDLSGYANVKSR